MPNTSKFLVWLAVLLLGVALYAAGYFFLMPQKYEWPPYMTELLSARTMGDDAAALAQYQVIQSDPNTTDEVKAVAVISVAGISTDTSAQLRDIRALKKVITDTTITRGVRAMAMAILGNTYNSAGGDSPIFAEIYTGAPFDSFLVPGDSQLSAINLEKASYAMSTTSTAAINIAFIASEIAFNDPGAAGATAYVALAEDYVEKANAAVVFEAQAGPWYPDSTLYINYRRLKAITIGRLAIVKGGEYEDIYRNEFEDFFTFAKSKLSTAAQNGILSARFQYAKILAADGDALEQKKQLDLLAQALDGLSNPDLRFVAFLKNEYTYRPTGPGWLSVQEMFKVSPGFKAAVGKVIGAEL